MCLKNYESRSRLRAELREIARRTQLFAELDEAGDEIEIEVRRDAADGKSSSGSASWGEMASPRDEVTPEYFRAFDVRARPGPQVRFYVNGTGKSFTRRGDAERYARSWERAGHAAPTILRFVESPE